MVMGFFGVIDLIEWCMVFCTLIESMGVVGWFILGEVCCKGDVEVDCLVEVLLMLVIIFIVFRSGLFDLGGFGVCINGVLWLLFGAAGVLVVFWC